MNVRDGNIYLKDEQIEALDDFVDESDQYDSRSSAVRDAVDHFFREKTGSIP